MSVNWQAIDYDTNIKIYISSIKQKGLGEDGAFNNDP